jgi:FtsH-binding integral membrane protein
MAAPSEMPRAYLPVGEASVESRARFITRTYNHLMGSIVLFTLLEVWFFTTGIAETLSRAMAGTSWLLVLGGFMLATWLATRVAHGAESLAAQ